MKKILFSIIILLLFAIALLGNNGGDDFSDTNAELVSYITNNPAAAEVFALSDAAVET